MDREEVRAHIEHWVTTCLTVPSPLFNGLPPCPYSREALVKGKVDLRLAGDRDMVETLLEIGRDWDDQHVIVLLAADRRLVDPAPMARQMSELNRLLEPMDLVSFFDHPDCTDPYHRVQSSNGEYVLAGMQRLAAFIQAAKPLHKRKYFEAGVVKQFEFEKHLGARKQDPGT